MARSKIRTQRSKRDRFITDRLVDRAIDRHLAAERLAQQRAWEVENGVMSAVEGEVGPNGWVNVSYA